MAIVPEDLTPQKKDALAILLGILLLEHHDKNYLAGDNASRSIAKIELMLKAIEEGRKE